LGQSGDFRVAARIYGLNEKPTVSGGPSKNLAAELPARLGDAWKLTTVCHVAEANT
jgi:hypothetical protein